MELIENIWKNADLQFTFKWEAELFAKQHDLELIYNDGDMIDNEHYEIRGYKSKLYWIAR